jgi:hypothetical protein
MAGLLAAKNYSPAAKVLEKAPEVFGAAGMAYKEHQRSKDRKAARTAEQEKRTLMQEEVKLAGE